MNHFFLSALLSVCIVSASATSNASTQSEAVRCAKASSDLSSDLFSISSDEIGSTVAVGDGTYTVVSSQGEYHDDIFMQSVTLQSLKFPEAAPLEIFCF